MKGVSMRSLLVSALAVGVAVSLAGCGQEPKKGFQEYSKSEKGPAATHEHHDHAPHDGHLVHLGGHKYHGEVCFAPKEDNKLTVYLYGHELSEPLAIPEKEVTLSLLIDGKGSEFTLKAVPQQGDAEGKSSRFELAGDLVIAEKIKDEEDLAGNLTVMIDGKPYTGEIEHDHDHDHAHGHAHGDMKEGDKPADSAEKKPAETPPEPK